MIQWVLRLAPLPAVLLGALVAFRTGVPLRAFAPNFVGLLIGCSFLGAVDRFKFSFQKRRLAISVAILLLAASTLFFEGLGGVHRWMWLGPLSLNVSMAFLPVLVFAIYEIVEQSTVWALALLLATTVVHALQPDLGQSLVFFASMSAVAIAKPFAKPFNKSLPRFLCVLIPLFGVVVTAFQPDHLAPVEHVERIYALIAIQGLPEIIELIFSLAMLFAPFWYFSSNVFEKHATHQSRRAIVAIVYLGSALAAPLVGNFPTPVFGAGFAGVAAWYTLMASTRPQPA